MSDFVPPGLNLNAKVEQSSSEGLSLYSMLTHPTLSVLICEGNNVCYYLSDQQIHVCEQAEILLCS